MDTPDLADSDRWVWCKCIGGELGLGFEEEGGELHAYVVNGHVADGDGSYVDKRERLAFWLVFNSPGTP